MIDVTKLVDIEVDGIDTRDYPDFTDAFIASAVWKDTLKDLSDNELDDLNDNYGDFVYDKVQEHLF